MCIHKQQYFIYFNLHKCYVCINLYLTFKKCHVLASILAETYIALFHHFNHASTFQGMIVLFQFSVIYSYIEHLGSF